MPAQRLKDLLDRLDIPYVTIAHSPAYTAQGIAHMAHIPGAEMAKTVVVRADGRLVLAVLPASRRVNLTAFRDAIGAKDVEIATESDFIETFAGCELGAMPPFGVLWDIPVFSSDELAEHELIAFNAGTHTELLRMYYSDYERVAQPTVVSMGHVLA